MVEPDGAVDVLQTLVAEVPQVDGEILFLVLEQALRRLRDEHLPAVTRSADAGGAMDREPRVTTIDRRAPGRVDPIRTLTSVSSGHG